MNDVKNRSNRNQTPTRIPSGEQKLTSLLANWVDKGVQLNFHLRNNEVLTGKLLYQARYEYVVQTADDKPAVVMKHTVDWIERASNSTAGDKK